MELHHLMEYLEGFPSFKLTYRLNTRVDDGFSGFADSDWGNNSSRSVGQAVSIQQVADSLALEDAEDYRNIN